jgi:drug/metabolite transporter (DMT)-like permease
MTERRPRSLAATVEGTSREDFAARDWAELALSALIFGSSFLFITIALRSYTAGAVAFFKTALGAGALALVPAARCRIRREDWGRLVTAALLGMAVPTILFAIAQERVSSALAGMLVSSIPILTAAVAAVETRALPKRLRLLGLVIGFIGVTLLGVPNLTGAGTEAVGVVLIFGAVLAHSIAMTVYAPLQLTYGSLRVSLWLMVVAAVMLLPFGIAGLPGSTVELGPSASLLLLGVVGTGLVWMILLGVIGRVGAVRASVAGYFIPVIALVMGVVFLDESVEVIQVIGVGIALAGGYLLSRGEQAVDIDATAALEAEPAVTVVHLDPSCRPVTTDVASDGASTAAAPL